MQKLAELKKQNNTEPLGKVWLVVLNVLLIFIFSQVLAAFLVQLFIHLLGQPSSTFDNSALAQFIYVLIAEGMAAGAVLLILKRRKLKPATIALGRRPMWSDIPKALIGFFVFYVLIIVLNGLISLIYPNLNNGNQDVGFNNLNGVIDGILAFCALVFFPPIGEEILVRGYLYSGFRQRFNFRWAMLLTSLFFGAAHLGTGDSGILWAAGLNTFALSIVLVYLRENTGALYAGMLVHMLNNLVAFGFHFHI